MYRTQEFARLCGVTVRALHHYDRLNLLKPRRTAAGYRIYGLADLERLEQIVALQFLGMPLKQIKALLERETLALPDALRLQRQVLEEKRRMLDRAIRAIREAETAASSGSEAKAALLTKIIEVIAMENSADWMAKYHTESARAKIESRRHEWTPELQERVSKQWTDLLAEAEASLHEDPAGEHVQSLAARWTELVAGFTGGDPEIASGLRKLYADHANWPSEFRQQVQPFYKPEVWKFMEKAIAIRQGR